MINLPLLPREPDPAQPVTRSRRVMLVDDNIDAVQTTAEILRMSGLDVAVAFDPLQALELARTFMPDVAVIDIGLPVMDGHQLAAELRGPDCSPSLRLIAMSGYGQSDDLRKSADAGFERHLVKPVHFDELVAIVLDVPLAG